MNNIIQRAMQSRMADPAGYDQLDWIVDEAADAATYAGIMAEQFPHLRTLHDRAMTDPGAFRALQTQAGRLAVRNGSPAGLNALMSAQ